MISKKTFYLVSLILLSFSLFGNNFYSEASQPSVYANNQLKKDNTEKYCSHLMKWDIEVEKNSFHICVNRNEKTITVRGEAEDLEQKDKVEQIIELRAPSNFQIINKIDIFENGLG